MATNPQYVRYQGENNVYDTATGKIVTYAEAQQKNLFAPGVIKDITGANPYASQPITQASFSGQTLTPYEMSQIKPVQAANTNTNLDKGATTANTYLNNVITAANVNRNYDKEIADVNAALASAKKVSQGLEDTQLFATKDIANNPDFTQTLAQRRTAFLSSPQSPLWEERILAQRELQSAVENQNALFTRIDRQTALDNASFQKALDIFNIMKPDIKQYAVDKNGDMVGLVYDPTTNGFSSQTLIEGVDLPKGKYTNADIQVTANGTYFSGIDAATGEPVFKKISNVTNQAATVPGLTVPSTGANAPYADALANVSAYLPADQAKRAQATVSDYLTKGNTAGAKQYLQNLVYSAVPAAQQSAVIGRFQALNNLSDVQSALAEYTAAGGNTNLLTGKVEEFAQKVGVTSNPELAAIANRINLSIQAYRQAISGAAFTESETKQYNAAFPSTGNVKELNEAKIKSLQAAFNANNKAIVQQYIGPSNYDALFGTSTAAPAGNNIGSQFVNSNPLGI
jgi:hypothetical protein